MKEKESKQNEEKHQSKAHFPVLHKLSPKPKVPKSPSRNPPKQKPQLPTPPANHNNATENSIQESWLLISAVKRQQTGKVLQLIDATYPKYQSTLWINERDPFGWSALHYASFFGNVSLCRLLLENGEADINIQTSRGQETPLYLASACNHVEVIKYLLSRNADVNIADYTGKIALEVSYDESYAILAEEQLKQNKLVRFIPTARKLLANKFFQFLLQLLLCVFLELFYDKLMVRYFFLI